MVANFAPVFGYGLPGVAEIADVQNGGHILKLLVAPDGSIVLVGDVPNGTTYSQLNGGVFDPDSGFTTDLTLWRVDALGRLSPEFGSDGMRQAAINGNMSVLDAAIQPDGKIIVVGSSWNSATQSSSLATARFNTDGTLDTTFGGTGIVLNDFIAVQPAAVLLQADGKIVFGGYTVVDGSNPEAAFIRYNADGTLDTSFHGNGELVTSLGPSNDVFRAMQETDGGKLLVLLSSFSSTQPSARSFDLLRFNADGTPDSTFGSGGEVVQAIASGPGNTSRAIYVQADGKIIVYGTQFAFGFEELTLTRFLADGTLDSSFGTQGTIALPAMGRAPAVAKILEQRDGKLLIVDFAPDGAQSELLRLNSDGSRDASFGDGGRGVAPPGSTITDFVLKADGSIVTTGAFSLPSSDGSFTAFVMRFRSDGTIDSVLAPGYAFAREGIADVHDTVVDIAPAGGVFDPEARYFDNYAVTSLTLARHGGAVAADTFGADGPVSLQNGQVLYDQVPIGSFTNTGGTLQISWLPFPSKIAEGVVDSVMQHITWHTEPNPAGTSVSFDWTFNDGSNQDHATATATSTVYFANVVHGTAAAETLTANAPQQVLDGQGSNDSLVGSAYNDIFIGGSGNDTLAGGSDGWTDTALYNGPIRNYTIEHQPDGTFVITDHSGADGTDVLSHIDRVQFADARVALDIEGNAGQAYRLYQAAFNRVPDLGGLGYQMNALDIGLTLTQVAGNFIASPEFQRTYGNVGDTQFVTLLYQNVLHRAPDSGGLQYHLDELASGQSRALVLTHFSESPENQANVVGQIQDGMIFLG